MEEIEVPLEDAQEHIKHHAEAHGGEKRWVLGVALSSAIFAALAAVASLEAGHRVNEALISQLQASDSWSYYQAEGIKSKILGSKNEMLVALGKPLAVEDSKAAKKYEDKRDEIKKEATKLEAERDANLRHHVTLATAVTMFQVSIAVAAISVLVQRKMFWWVSLGFGAIGAGFILAGLLGG